MGIIKKARVSELYQINLYCDKCGKRMVRSNVVLDSFPPQFTYNCECGNTATSFNCYPMQSVIFDEVNAEVISEDDIKIN